MVPTMHGNTESTDGFLKLAVRAIGASVPGRTVQYSHVRLGGTVDRGSVESV